MAYSDKFKAKAIIQLGKNNGNISKTASEMGIDRKTLQRWANGQMGNAEEVAELLEATLKEIIQQVPDFTKPGNAHSWPNAIREVTRALQLLSGGATERTENKNANFSLPVGMSQDEYERAIRQLVNEAVPEVGPKLPEEMTDEEYSKALKAALKDSREG